MFHRDIKPENFLIGRKDPQNIYLIDFGFSRKFRSSRTGKHIKCSNIKKAYGTFRYMSKNANKGYELSRRDDLESFGYMIIYLAKNNLPWLYLENSISDTSKLNKAIYIFKNSITSEQLCKDLPEEFNNFIKYVRNLDFEQNPDYSYLKGLFISVLSRNELKNDLLFSWITNKGEITNQKGHVRRVDQRGRKNSKSRLYNKIKKSLEKENNRHKKMLIDLSLEKINNLHNNQSLNKNNYNNYNNEINKTNNIKINIYGPMKSDYSNNRKINLFKNENNSFFIRNIRNKIMPVTSANISKDNISNKLKVKNKIYRTTTTGSLISLNNKSQKTFKRYNNLGNKLVNKITLNNNYNSPFNNAIKLSGNIRGISKNINYKTINEREYLKNKNVKTQNNSIIKMNRLNEIKKTKSRNIIIKPKILNKNNNTNSNINNIRNKFYVIKNNINNYSITQINN